MTPAATDAKTLVLKSSDGEEFIVAESATVLSATIKNLVDDGCTDDVIPLLNVDAKDLSKIILYLNKHTDDSLSRNDLKKFDDDFLSGESVDDLLPFFMAANYLNIVDLFDLLAQRIADLIKDYSVERFRKLFNIENDFAPGEEEEIKQEFLWAFEGIDLNDQS